MDPLKAKANFSRVCQLLIDKGGEAFRAVLHAKHPPLILPAVLNTHKSFLQRIKVITSSQWNLLFPTSGIADSSNFDITLLTILLRNICGLTKPSTGWDFMPPTGDVSISADIARIKVLRNQVYGHIPTTQLDDATFQKLWQEISQPLIRLGVPKKDIDEIEMAPLSPREKSDIEKLKEWKERDACILSKLDTIEDKVDNMLLTQSKPQEWEPSNILPDKLMIFTGREAEIQKVIAFLRDEEKAVVSLSGGPGFGKTAIAIQVSHKLSEDPEIRVLFSQLATATNEDEMIRRLCLDVGVNHENEPKQSMIFRLQNIKMKFILVMDDIEKLLEEKSRSAFDDFIHLLRMHSNCQIITTSRSSYSIPQLSIGSIDVGEMEVKASIELLRQQCPEQDEMFLRRLAERCGNIPLAMCIAGSLVDDFEDSDELLDDLEKQPMDTLECPERNQYVKRAINMSYEKCSDDEQEMFVCLSVFEGSFSENAAKTVIKKGKSDARRFLKKLFRRSLIKQPTKHRYSIHLLIKHFLKDKQKSGDEKGERASAKAMHAQVLMVEYYLELGNQLTIKSYSKDCYKEKREALKQEASNIENVLKISSQRNDSVSSTCLASSKIYNVSARFFSVFIRTIIPGPIVDEFLQRCANLAKEKEQHAIKINFDCLLADRERSKLMKKCNEDSDEHYISTIQKIKEEFDTHYEDLKQDKSLCAYFYNQYGRYLSFISRKYKDEKRLSLEVQAREQLEESLKVNETDTPEGQADMIFSLMRLGTECKFIYLSQNYLKNTKEANEAVEQAETYYSDAIKLSKVNLGEHQLTSWCHKNLGDLFLTNKKPEQAEKMYTFAKNMLENLGLDATERYVLLLKNYGTCLAQGKHANEAIEVLERARDIAEKLAEQGKPNECKTKVYTRLAITYDLLHKNSEAVYYAIEARKFRNAIQRGDRNKLDRILSKNAGSK